MAKIFCKKYQQELDALMLPPLPGEKGEKLMQNYSQAAWNEWIKLQTMLINERRLDLSEKENRKWLNEQMMLFLENGDYKKPDGFIPLEN